MITQPRSVPLRRAGRTSGAMDGPLAGVRGLSRLVQVALALYLIPALLIVLVVGGSGMLILAVARILTAIVYGPASSLSSDLRHNDRRS